MTALPKRRSGKGPKSDPKSGPLRGGQVSENTRKTNGFDSFLTIWGTYFGTHFGVTFGSPPGSCLLRKLIKNEESGEPDAKEMDSDPRFQGFVLQKKVQESTFEKWMSKKADSFYKKSEQKK